MLKNKPVEKNQSAKPTPPVPIDIPMWKSMSTDEYASIQFALGAKIFRRGGVWWRQVRPFFYRPLLPYREFSPETLAYPFGSLVGGVQHLVPDAAKANSHLDLLLFENPREYSLERLTQNKRYQVRRATKTFSVSQIADVDHFVAEAHPVYLSFYERTKYSYRSERTEQRHFAAWARALFSFPKVLVLGAYREGQLLSVSVTYLVEDVVFVAVAFSHSDALHDYVSDRLLHIIRENAASNGDTKLIFASTAGLERGLEDFYLQRGAIIAQRPALLKMNPLAKILLKTFKNNELEKFGANS